jgi:oxygen-independent coproporphyrinogen-3 oxidase
LQAVLEELTTYREMPALANRRFAFVYFGGGTPSLLSARQIGYLMEAMQKIIPWDNACEVTFECAPKSVTPWKLDALRRNGVTRASLGIQQLSDDVLTRNGRMHLVRDVRRAYADIERAGFVTINVDLMVGMAGKSDQSFFQSLNEVISMQPDSVTIYQMEIPHNTPLYRASRDGLSTGALPGWEVKRRRLAEAFERLEASGYAIATAYAAIRDPRQHRFVYQWAQYHGADLLGVGASSFSYLAGVHYQNAASLGRYCAKLEAGQLPAERAYALTADERLVREFVLQLKLGRASARRFRNKFGVELAERFTQQLSAFAQRKWLTLDRRGVALSREGLLRVDRLLPAFYLPQHAEAPYW